MQCFLVEGLSLSSIQPECGIAYFSRFIYNKEEEELRPVVLFQATNKNSESLRHLLKFQGYFLSLQ